MNTRQEDILYYKEATPKDLNTQLMSHPLLKERWKLIPRIVKMLNQILTYNEKDGGQSDITYKFFHDLYKEDYTRIIQALEVLDLLKVKRLAIPKSGNFKGKCYTYKVTETCQTLLDDTNKEYLYKLHYDKPTIRKVQQLISNRKYNQKQYGDTRDEIKSVIDGIGYDYEKMEKVISRMKRKNRTLTRNILTSIKDKTYKDLTFNDSDGRMWNLYTQLPSRVKKILTVNGLPMTLTIDIRSCYPCLFSTFIKDLFPLEDLQEEHKKWIGVFLDPTIDPKKYLSKLLNIPKKNIKNVMNKYFNGYTVRKEIPDFFEFDKWLQREFPKMYTLWKTTNIKETGNNIGKRYETKLMLDQTIYDKAKEMGIKIGYEYDGMSFFGGDNLSCQQLLEYITNKSFDLLGFKLVFKEK